MKDGRSDRARLAPKVHEVGISECDRARPSRRSERFTRSACRRLEWPPEGVGACVDGASDARGKVRILTGRSIAIMCPALLTRHHDRWPRWYPRSRPKHMRDFESRCTKRVLWIVGSTDRHLIRSFTPASTRGSGGHRLMPAVRPMRHRGPCRLGHLDVQSRPKPRGGSIA